MENPDPLFEVIIVGGGMAGLSAALSAVEHGARVLVLEKSERIGGNASIAAGMFLGATDFDGLHAYIPDGNPALQRSFCADFMSSISWLESHGLPIGPTTDFGDFRKLRPMASGQPGDRQIFMDSMAARASECGVEIKLCTRVTDLRRVQSGIAVDVLGKEGCHTLIARSVVFASGGFASNLSMLEKYLGPQARFLKTRSLAGADGDGVVLGQKLGAAIGGEMSAFYGHTMADCVLDPSDWQPLTPYFARSSVLVNREGRRFVDESASLLEEMNAQAGFRQPGGKYWLLFDERVRKGEASSNGSDKVLPALDWLVRARTVGAPLIESSTTAELIAKLENDGVDAVTLASEIDSYNSACESNCNMSLQPPKRLNAFPLKVPPFYALRCVAGITATCGGLAVDDCGRVLDAIQRPLNGLFAGGPDAGGVFGKTYGGFLSWAVISGRRAGRTAAS